MTNAVLPDGAYGHGMLSRRSSVSKCALPRHHATECLSSDTSQYSADRAFYFRVFTFEKKQTNKKTNKISTTNPYFADHHERSPEKADHLLRRHQRVVHRVVAFRARRLRRLRVWRRGTVGLRVCNTCIHRNSPTKLSHQVEEARSPNLSFFYYTIKSIKTTRMFYVSMFHLELCCAKAAAS